MTDGKIHCVRCQRRLQRKEFYLDKDGQPMEKCKKCITSMIDVESPSTFMHVLEEVDVPYIPMEWDKLKDRYLYSERNGIVTRNPEANQSIFGRYIAKMKLAQYRDFTYKDTARFVEEEGESRATRNKELLERFSSFLEEGMSEEDALNAMGMPINSLDLAESTEIHKPQIDKDELSRLQFKWGRTYKVEELQRLEKLYDDMKDSYEITTASHEDYLRQICKTSFRMHQSIDQGDYEAYHKLSGVYDKMMKSAKFTASQEKEEERFIDSISEMVRLCEEQGFIPLYHTYEPQDVVDVTERDLKNYTEHLVKGELGLGDLIEQAIDQIVLDEEKDRMEGDLTDDDLFDEIGAPTEEDYLEDLQMEMESLGPVRDYDGKVLGVEEEVVDEEG